MDVDSSWAALVALIGALLLIVTFAAARSALATISRSRVRGLIEQNVRGASEALRLIDDSPHMNNVIAMLDLILVAVIAAASVLATPPGVAPGLMVALAMAITLMLQALAAGAGARWCHRIAPALAPVIRVLLLLVSPLHALMLRFNRLLAGAVSPEGEEALRLGEEELRVLASVVGEGDADLPEEGREMIHSIVTLGQTTVREVMVPRPDIMALRSDITMVEALDAIIRDGHSRIPIYDESVDNIVGVLYAKDLLAYLRDGRTDVPLRDLLRPALFVPTSKMADELLEELQRGRVHLAIVFDEYGGTAGLVTIEDILEEIVGEIQDEYDAEEAAFVMISPYEAIVSGLLDIDDLNHEMDLELPTDENDTVGGLIYSALGRVPLVGDEVRMEQGVTFRVLSMVGRRISSVRVQVDHVEPFMPDSSRGDGDQVTVEESAAGRGGSPTVGLSRFLFR